MTHKDTGPLPTTQVEQRQPASVAAAMAARAIDAQAATIIGWILQGGVLVSAAVILTGVVWLFLQPGGPGTTSVARFPHSLPDLLAGLLQWQAPALIVLGLVLLIATPVLRVATSIIAFALERDLRYVLITLVVLLILLYSLFFGDRGTSSTHLSSLAHFHFSALVFALIFCGSVVAGLLGSLIGLGGGVLIVPLLTLAFGLPISFAIGASIISVIATSSGAAAAYVRDRITNMRVGMFLELATTTGAISGAFLAGLLAPGILGVIFGIILLLSALPTLFKMGEELPSDVQNDWLATHLSLASSYPDEHLGHEVSYQVTRTPLGLILMYVAGVISGLLGIGSGAFKVLAMDVVMRLPLKVSTTTSNFMIGVTAAASAGIYFARGDIPPLVAAPVALGILLGALIGSRLLSHLSNRVIRLVFLPVIVATAVEMILHGLGIGGI
nr:TSUP family transporter [Thermogemmatispora carboxidivorans]